METYPILINRQEIENIVYRLSEEIVKDHQIFNFVTVLEGAKPFSRDLRRQIAIQSNIPQRNYDIMLKSYQEKKSTKEIRILKDIKEDISGLDMIIIEDIFDTGNTLSFLKNYLLDIKKIKSVKICTLLSKPSKREIEVPVDYIGKEIENFFVVGYGFDNNGKDRDLNYIGYIG